MAFNLCVNAGQGKATRILQEVAGAAVDGRRIGPLTLAAVRGQQPADLITRFAERQMTFYRSLDGWKNSGRGWTARTERVRAKALAMAGG
ncbi:putative peptidoglycan-binding domain-containing protein [Muricoccus vinaceus]|uniref:Peptidoglycan-binding domain-containing protein n=1 Tax=Muricoccus vinaceus TaxID=424704 RepID=A0ABV6ILE1_9PROT